MCNQLPGISPGPTPCQSCVTGSDQNLLSCEWCPSNLLNVSAYLVSGACVPAGTCQLTSGVVTCVTPPIFSLVGCPDSCLGRGTCTNYTLNASCFDNTQDEGETDVDCGGPCYPCPPTKKCKVNSDCLSQLCQNGTSSSLVCGGSGFYAAGGITSQHCVCVSGYSGINCGVSPLVENSTVIIAVGLSTAAIAGIIVAAVLFVLLCGGGSAAVYNGMVGGPVGILTSNPLYKGPATSAENPLFRVVDK